MSFTATQRTGDGFSWIFRFVINPLFLFSGTFFPLTQLPEGVQWIAAATPLYHGVELVRGFVLSDATSSPGGRSTSPTCAIFALGFSWLAHRLLHAG